jgi:hypothetical protein
MKLRDISQTHRSIAMWSSIVINIAFACVALSLVVLSKLDILSTGSDNFIHTFGLFAFGALLAAMMAGTAWIFTMVEVRLSSPQQWLSVVRDGVCVALIALSYLFFVAGLGTIMIVMSSNL